MNSKNVGTETPSRGRREKRITGDERQQAILASAELLLNGRPFRDVSIDDLARGAGISRPTFYFYFQSKDAVLLALIDGLSVEGHHIKAFEGLEEDALGTWRQAIDGFYSAFHDHKPLVLAWAEARSSVPEAARLWSLFISNWANEVVFNIEAERRRGAAPEGLPAGELATALLQMNERVILASFAGEPSSVAEDRVADVLAAIWIAAIYKS
ncbi:TetR/AcrR family transcriptional regulator [Rhodococcus sp. H29-C3]|uniref:TetR/AcrR family transcriptional regulator n=1 Tax=Rhodococcus sp. H29-C3 TaxID=3046307 RepID=UPI0024BB5EF4|nr:TetR/AcrR family transcriptional regulator [Rhodococcus sp. H29-C3]MDJ0359038.1 TetR/AcrR family transcriptional regulator [Rhodococcus sp. H29-C3]